MAVTASHPLENLIEQAFERRSEISPSTVDPALAQALDDILQELNAGRLRVADKRDGTWITHQWIKKAVLLYFRTHDNRLMPAGSRAWFDKVPLRFTAIHGGAVSRGAASAWCRRRRCARGRSSAAT